MKKIAVVICWIGPLPDMFRLWSRSCAANPTVDWLLFTDQEPGAVPQNLHVIRTSLGELARLAREKLACPDLSLETAYKLCDYKPMYGMIFDDHLKGYDFWGHCDMDMIFGDLRSFFTDELLERYDKLLACGHLSLYRNTPEVNRRCLLPGGRYSAEEVMHSPRNYAFDEWRGVFLIYKENGFPMYEEVPYADISFLHKRFSLQRRSSPKYRPPAPDFKHQLFYWEDGKVFRAYIGPDGRVETDTFLYIHMMKRKFPPVTPETEAGPAFYCTPSGFVPKIPGRLPDEREIRKLNPYHGFLYEAIERKIRERMLRNINHKTFVRRRGKRNDSPGTPKFRS